jgi:hypothetical protein
VAAPIVLAPYENGLATRKNPGALASSFSPAITHDIEVWRWIGAIRPGKPSGSQVDGALPDIRVLGKLLKDEVNGNPRAAHDRPAREDIGIGGNAVFVRAGIFLHVTLIITYRATGTCLIDSVNVAYALFSDTLN